MRFYNFKLTRYLGSVGVVPGIVYRTLSTHLIKKIDYSTVITQKWQIALIQYRTWISVLICSFSRLIGGRPQFIMSDYLIAVFPWFFCTR
jgi:hypothetical protein